MSKILHFLAVAVALASNAGANISAADAQPSESLVATASSLGRKALDDPAAFDFVESLTTEIGQRLAGTAAHRRAVAWAEARLKAAGFEDVHSEPFTFPAWIRGAESAEIVGSVPQHLAVTALGGSVATDANGIEAEIALFRTYDELLAAAPGSLNGKIAVVTQHMVRTQDGSGYGAANPIRRYGPSEAAKRGAVAYLLRSLGTDSHRLAHTGALNYKDGAPRIPAAALAIPDAEQLERLAALGPVRIRLLLTPTVQEKAPSWNVVGEIKGSGRPDEIILIGGHLDSWDLGTGATDDGAGIAITFGAARLIASLPLRPRRTIRVVLFGAEEMDFSGAAYARAHEGETGKIMVAAEADFGARNVYSVQLPPGAAGSDFGHTLQRIIAPLGANVDSRPALGSGEDIRDLQKAGVPTASLRQDGLDYFDTHHTADDTLDKIDPKQLNQAVAVWSVFTYLAATSDVDFRSLAPTAKIARAARVYCDELGNSRSSQQCLPSSSKADTFHNIRRANNRRGCRFKVGQHGYLLPFRLDIVSHASRILSRFSVGVARTKMRRCGGRSAEPDGTERCCRSQLAAISHRGMVGVNGLHFKVSSGPLSRLSMLVYSRFRNRPQRGNDMSGQESTR